MDAAEWIIVGILSATLFIFLVCGIIFLIKLISLTKQANEFAITANEIAKKADSIAEKADGVAENVKNITYAGTLAGMANLIKESYSARKAAKENRRDDENV